MRRVLRKSLLVPGTIAMVLATGLTSLAQSAPSLAEVARREVARRKALASPGRVFTNEDLKRNGALTTAAAKPATPASAGAASTASDPPTAKRGDALADRIDAARGALARLRADFDAQQARVMTLTAAWVGAPDEATRTSIAAAREAAATEAERIRADIDAQVEALAQLELDVLRQMQPVPPPK